VILGNESTNLHSLDDGGPENGFVVRLEACGEIRQIVFELVNSPLLLEKLGKAALSTAARNDVFMTARVFQSVVEECAATKKRLHRRGSSSFLRSENDQGG
jgi:hypothetical protein